MSRIDLEGCDAILVPGGFAYGDYLRTGAIARFAPIMQSVRRFADSGGLVHGHLQRLPDPVRGRPAARRADAQRGASATSAAGASAHRDHRLAVHHGLARGQVLKHAHRPHGRQLLLRRRDAGHAAARGPHRLPLCDPGGRGHAEANPNGSLDNIAGILSEGRNVLGMMPHPDRSSEALLGSADGPAALPGHGPKPGLGIGAPREAQRR
jgi:hypothetical protein